MRAMPAGSSVPLWVTIALAVIALLGPWGGAWLASDATTGNGMENRQERTSGLNENATAKLRNAPTEKQQSRGVRKGKPPVAISPH